MNIVLIPGLDGTGELFAELIPHLGDNEIQIIDLPQQGDQSYEFLCAYVVQKLPKRDFILVAESFSGPIGALLAKSGLVHMKGIVFVARFLTPPNKALISIAKLLPIKQLLRFPFSSLVVRYLMLGQSASETAAQRFFQILSNIPNAVLKARLSTVQNFTFNDCEISVPAIYIRAEKDKLVPKNKCFEFENHFINLKIQTISGPHFILQSSPKQCAEIISQAFK